jgi:hypothetical protein
MTEATGYLGGKISPHFLPQKAYFLGFPHHIARVVEHLASDRSAGVNPIPFRLHEREVSGERELKFCCSSLRRQRYIALRKLLGLKCEHQQGFLLCIGDQNQTNCRQRSRYFPGEL